MFLPTDYYYYVFTMREIYADIIFPTYRCLSVSFISMSYHVDVISDNIYVIDI